MSWQELWLSLHVPGPVPALAQVPEPTGSTLLMLCWNNKSDFTAFPAALSVYEGAHKKVLWAIVPRGSIQEEIKLLCFFKNIEP